ncbi:MAG: YchJ family metal-binding protein [Gammaproteobacteria bacterium]|nr:YchJ family metal-binding protein [Gammaproteobacteria bacterium]
MLTCPCNDTQSFHNCCQPYLRGEKTAGTPEILMRSRYTAYTLADIAYIQKTMRQKAAKDYDPVSAKKWALSVQWLGLTVIDAPPAIGNIGTVTFTALFSEQGVTRSIHEKSIFEKINNEWFYIDRE